MSKPRFDARALVGSLLSSLAIVALAAVGCSSAPADPPPAVTDTLEQELDSFCPPPTRCILFGHDSQGNVICLRCAKLL